jgi:glycogen(starch) synthase
MKLLFIVSGYASEQGGHGGSSYYSDLAEALVARGHSIHVLSCCAGQRDSDRLENGVVVHRRGTTRIPGLSRAGRLIGLNATVARLQAGLSAYAAYRRLGERFDVTEYADWGAEGWIIAALHRGPLVAGIHLPLPVLNRFNRVTSGADARVASWIERGAVARADLATCPSALVAHDLEKLGWFSARPPRIIPCPVNLAAWRTTAAVAGTDPVVVFVGRLEPIKGPDVLARAIGILRRENPGVRAIFVGRTPDGGTERGLFPWASGEIDTRGCTFLGALPRARVVEIMSQARVFALPSRFDNFPIAALEAMAAGRPVVVTSQTGVAGLVQSHAAGAVVPPDDPEALANALRPFLTDARAAEAAGRRARRAVEPLDRDLIAARREGVYEQAIALFRGQASRVGPEPSHATEAD